MRLVRIVVASVAGLALAGIVVAAEQGRATNFDLPPMEATDYVGSCGDFDIMALRGAGAPARPGRRRRDPERTARGQRPGPL
jgi:hypothetical protein